MEQQTIEGVLTLIEKRPADADLYQQLGKLYSSAGRLQEARAALERSLELDSKDAFTHLYLGNNFYASREYSEALDRFLHAAELLPDQAVAYWCQGDAYLKLGRFTLAQQAFEAAVRVDPNDRQAREKLAAWRESLRGTAGESPELIRIAYRNDQAATTVLLASRWIQAHPDDLWVIHDHAKMLYQMSRYDEAIQIYLDAIERFEEWRCGLYNHLGHLHRYRGDFALAEQWYQKAVDEHPDDAGSYIFLGGVQARQGKLKQAETTHRRATQCPDGMIEEAYHNLGLVLRGQGRLAEAADSFRKAIELCSEYADAAEALRDVEAALMFAIGGETEQGIC